jgi:hypothetical protein
MQVGDIIWVEYFNAWTSQVEQGQGVVVAVNQTMVMGRKIAGRYTAEVKIPDQNHGNLYIGFDVPINWSDFLGGTP